MVYIYICRHRQANVVELSAYLPPEKNHRHVRKITIGSKHCTAPGVWSSAQSWTSISTVFGLQTACVTWEWVKLPMKLSYFWCFGTWILWLSTKIGNFRNSQLTNSMIFQRGRSTTNQKKTYFCGINIHSQAVLGNGAGTSTGLFEAEHDVLHRRNMSQDRRLAQKRPTKSVTYSMEPSIFKGYL